MTAPPAFEDTEGVDEHHFLILLLITLRERVFDISVVNFADEGGKGELPWADICFESKIQSNAAFEAWSYKILSVLSKRLNDVG